MSLHHSPRIVTNGLVFCVDPANIKSYPRSGNTWKDLSIKQRNVTLYNSPTFQSSNGGILTFDDLSFQYGETATAEDISIWTVDCWARFTKTLSGKVSSIITGQYNLATKLNFSIGINEATSFYRISAGFFDGSWRIASGFSPDLNKWYHFAGVYNGSTLKFYVNGILYSSLSYIGTPQSGGTFRIFRRWDDAANSTINFLKGDIGPVRVYNIALTDDQILQNYNAIRGRFNL